MPWDDRPFETLKTRLLAVLRGERRPASGVPFFVVVYDPAEEYRSLRRLEQLAAVLRGDGREAQVVYVGALMARVLERGLFLSDAGIAAENEQPDRLRSDLARSEGLPRWIAEALLQGEEGIAEALSEERPDRCTILLRTGALFPFAHVSQILNQLEGRTRDVVVAAFPGSRDPANPDTLRFLNETEGSYYRAEIIG